MLAQTRICLVGPTGSGKTTIARYVERVHGASLVKLAEPLYEIHDAIMQKVARHGIDVDGELIQFLAQKIMKLDDNFLFERFMGKIALDNSQIIINDDCRYNNYEKLRHAGFVFIRIETDKTLRFSRTRDRFIPLFECHATEQNFDDMICDYIVTNNEELSVALRQINHIIKNLAPYAGQFGWLTGNEIENAVGDGRITIDPFDKSLLNPNSYNYTLSSKIKRITSTVIDIKKEEAVEEIDINESGYKLIPGECYLGSTCEKFGSAFYASLLTGRSTIGRKFITNHICAGLIDQGFTGHITLEIIVQKPTIIYPYLPFGQIFWFSTFGQSKLYSGKYQYQNKPTKARLDMPDS